ncbi:MAG TPA: inositol monophosphatase [Candidatus Saccharimonadales bacterium]|nr:inositol monophosphatase [Candidatus Saccharimonadales bacterium]
MTRRPGWDSYCTFARQVALEAGAIMLSHFGTRHSHTKADGSPVTIADQLINDLVIARVRQQFPTHAILGEERSHAVAGNSHTWVCDPIDGTVPFMLGIPTNIFSLAMVDAQGTPVVAVAYDPYLQRMYWATAGSKAYVNQQSLTVSNTPALRTARVGFSGRSSRVLQAEHFTHSLRQSCNRLVTLQSIVYEAMLVATGAIDAAILMGDGAHDAAAACLIVRAAGGNVTDLYGDDQRYDAPVRGVILSNGGALHTELVTLAKSHMLTPGQS